jgi:hypothetical protein
LLQILLTLLQLLRLPPPPPLLLALLRLWIWHQRLILEMLQCCL